MSKDIRFSKRRCPSDLVTFACHLLFDAQFYLGVVRVPTRIIEYVDTKCDRDAYNSNVSVRLKDQVLANSKVLKG